MTDVQERRSPGSNRISLETLVEICGNDMGTPAFEAEALDVSARGMHLRTAYLPEEGAPLVCRFEDQGREIVVEGVVAWRKASSKGGDFGVKFTALDSRSVDCLRELVKRDLEQNDSSDETTRGSRVRLHIEGLGSPMKARVRGGGQKSVQVGSNLEFLKVGRRLEIEDLELGIKRGASIDSVNVAIDPQTQVPQLVVVLRYDDGAESTPEPSVIDSEAGATHRSPADPVDAVAEDPAGVADTETELDDEESEFEVADDADRIRGRVAIAATRASGAMQTTGLAMARFGAKAALGVGKLFRDASEKVIEYRNRRGHERTPRRTAAPPSAPLSAAGRRLRPQSERSAGSETADEAPTDKRKRTRRIAGGAAVVVLLTTVSVIAMRKSEPPPGADSGRAVAGVVASAENVTEVDEQGNPTAGKSLAKAAPNAAPAKDEADKNGISADVPLFGPTPMATMEPAPLGPAPDSADKSALDEGSEEAQELANAKSDAPSSDESWSESTPAAGKSKVKPEDVEPWGRGKLHTPTIHRLRLDGLGAAIQGAINPTGFTVVIPGRKVMESGDAIEKRDKRIAHVRTRNGTSGALVSFQFRDGVPGYRVRLRRDFVEILISSAEEQGGAQPSNSSTPAKMSTAHSGNKTGAKKSAKALPQTVKKTASKSKPKKG